MIKIENYNFQLKQIKLNGEKTRYVISSDGHVWNMESGKKMALNPNRDGYLMVNLSHNGKHYSPRINRLVAIMFIPNPEDKPEVHHKDGNILNNDVSNLQWCTRVEHFELERERVGKFIRAKGEDQGSSKYSNLQISRVIEDLEKHIPIKEISEYRHVNICTIRNIIHHKGWSFLTEGKDFSYYTMAPYKQYSTEIKEKAIELLKEGKRHKEICKELNLPYDERSKSYLKAIKRRNINNTSSTTSEKVS